MLFFFFLFWLWCFWFFYHFCFKYLFDCFNLSFLHNRNFESLRFVLSINLFQTTVNDIAHSLYFFIEINCSILKQTLNSERPMLITKYLFKVFSRGFMSWSIGQCFKIIKRSSSTFSMNLLLTILCRTFCQKSSSSFAKIANSLKTNIFKRVKFQGRLWREGYSWKCIDTWNMYPTIESLKIECRIISIVHIRIKNVIKIRNDLFIEVNVRIKIQSSPSFCVNDKL